MLVAGVNKLHPIYAVDTTEKKVAFSFDATWGSTRTPLILQTLEEYDIKTTFFLTNIWLNSYPQVAQEIVAKGHEPALHTANHPDLTKVSEERIRSELLENAAKIEEVTGQKAYLFRPPYGAYNNRVITIAEEEKMVPVQWSIDSLDWKNLSAGEITKRITDRIKPGAIILFHNDGANTPQALKPIIDYLTKEGYSIVPISELIYKENYYIDVNGIQKAREVPKAEAPEAAPPGEQPAE
ncbi:MAG: polysaccharide deacetylase family protein [Clostridia bacterium]|nr:polysaccharide deacetylase family protein [Clostridia bacterium]